MCSLVVLKHETAPRSCPSRLRRGTQRVRNQPRLPLIQLARSLNPAHRADRRVVTMNRFTSAVPLVLVFCTATAVAADEAPTTAAPVTAATAAATSTTPASQPGKVGQPSASTTSSSNPSVHRL